MRQTLKHTKKTVALAALAVALLVPTLARAGSAPFVMVAQQHNVEKEKKKGVVFHLTAHVNNLKDKPCTLAVYCFDNTGKAMKAIRKEYSDKGGSLGTFQALTPKFDYTRAQGRLFLPYDALSAERGLQEVQIVANVWSDTERKWLATIPFKAACWFNPSADRAEVERATKRFEQERETVALALRLNAQRKQAELNAFLQQMRRDAERRAEEAREEQRRADRRHADRLADQRRADQRHADRLAEQRRADQRHADRLAEMRRADQRRADQLAEQRRADQRTADRLAEGRRRDQERAQRLADERRRDQERAQRLADQRRAEENRRRR